MAAYHENIIYFDNLKIHIGIAKNFTFPAHWHQDLEIIHVIDGTIKIGINSELHIATRGDIIISNKDDIHYYDSSNLENKILVLIISSEIIQADIKPLCTLKTHVTEQMLVEYSLCDVIQNILHKAEFEYKNQLPNYNAIVKSLTIEFVSYLNRYFADNNTIKRKNKRIADNAQMQNLLNYLEQNCTSQITLEDAANFAHFSQWYFSRIFKALTGQTFTQYINNLRLQKADYMLCTTKETITSIALNCGFDNIRTFNRLYKRTKGTVPSESRK